MLPDVDAQEWNKSWIRVGDWVLIGRGSDADGIFVLVVNEPSPAWSLDASCSGIEGFDEVISSSPSLS